MPQCYDTFIAGRKEKPTNENTLAMPFIAAECRHAKRVEGKQLLEKLALLAMASQRLNKKRKRVKNEDRKEKKKFNFDFKNMFYDI